MKKSIYIVVLLLLFGFSKTDKTIVNVSSKSEIVIHGESNVNSFQCNYNQKLIATELAVTHYNKNNKTILEGATFLLHSKGFDCVHRMITNDLKEVLKADSYPHIQIDIVALKHNNHKLTAVAAIKIAGVVKQYEIPVEINEETKNVKGELKLNIKDFKLKSPKKILGLIKLNEEVTISFNLYLDF